jgi:nucleoside-diphosphate-sugar epimerase
MKVLITGSEGFVGRYFVEALKGHDITRVDIKGLGLVRGSYWGDCRGFFKESETKYDLVIHLAAIVGGRATIEGQPLSVAVDLSIDAEFFQWCLRTRPGRVVYFSSSAAYPIEAQYRDSGVKLTESMINLDNIRSPDLTYGWAKLTGEYQARFLEEAGIRTHVFRPFSGYGTDQALDYPFPSFIKRGLEKQDPFQIWGDGCQVRDFIHMSDVVAAVMAAIDNDVAGPVNLGLGRPTSFNDLAQMVAAKAHYKPEIQHLPAAPTGVMYRVCDPRKMLSFYTPKVSLEEGIARAFAHKL